MDSKVVTFSIMGGLALFIYGMVMLSDGLQLAFGSRMKQLLEKLTGNKFKGVAVGTFITMIIQSSSAATVMLVGLINAGLMTLSQAIPVIMGTNIGTTITAQLIAFKLDKLSLPIIAIGLAMLLISKSLKKDQWKHISTTVLGFGILFLGMNIMSSQVRTLTQDENVMRMMANLAQNTGLSVFCSIVVTLIVQSSSAVSGLVITMARGGMVDLPTSICFVLGANIGTTVTVCIAAFGGSGSLSAKRAAVAHVFIKIIGVLIFFPIIMPYANFIEGLSPGDIARQVANSHMIFNVICTVILLPFTSFIEKVASSIIKGKNINVESGTRFIDDNTLDTPSIALGLAVDETVAMAGLTLDMIESSRKVLVEKDRSEIEHVKTYENIVDDLDNKIEAFLQKINTHSLSQKQKRQLSVLTHTLSDIERIADHANNICQVADTLIRKKINFSTEAFDEVIIIFNKAEKSVKLSLDVIQSEDENLIKEILKIEREVDQLVIEYERKNLERLEKGLEKPEQGPPYMEILSNLERITDHTHNMAYAKRVGF